MTRRQHRAVADEWLVWGAIPRETSDVLACRARELTSPKHRVAVARVGHRFITELANPRCRAYAVNRGAMRTHYRLLVQLTERLERSEQAVSARGMILAERIFGDGAGPLFDRDRADELDPALAEALRALDADSES